MLCQQLGYLLDVCLHLVHSHYLSMAVQPFVEPQPLFQFLDLLRSL
jgi:hypothetical protein